MMSHLNPVFAIRPEATRIGSSCLGSHRASAMDKGNQGITSVNFQNALAESEHRLGLFVDAVRDYAIFQLDPAGNIRTWNAAAERMKGYAADEIVGRHFSCFYTPEDLASEKPQTELRVAAETGRSEDEGWRLRKDGSRFWAHVTITPIRDAHGTLIGFAKITRDDTERRKAEAALKESEAYLRALFEFAPDAIVASDPTGAITEVNSQTEKLFGYRRDELVGQKVEMLVPERFRQSHPS